jgi:hypothetical protein
MATLYEQRNISMTPDHWLALEALAVQMNCRSTRGPQAYQHSWRCLVEEIAAGRLLLTEREPYQMPPGLDEAVQKIEHRQHEQERVVQHRQRVAEQTKQAPKAPLKLTQLQMELEPA